MSGPGARSAGRRDAAMAAELEACAHPPPLVKRRAMNAETNEGERKKLEQRKRAEGEARDDLAKTLERLLADVHEESVNADQAHSPQTRTTAKFAALLCVLAVQAEKQTRQIVQLTWVLSILTAVLLVATILLAAITWSTDDRLREVAEVNQQSQGAKKHHSRQP
jgi:hypothetical protein